MLACGWLAPPSRWTRELQPSQAAPTMRTVRSACAPTSTSSPRCCGLEHAATPVGKTGRVPSSSTRLSSPRGEHGVAPRVRRRTRRRACGSASSLATRRALSIIRKTSDCCKSAYFSQSRRAVSATRGSASARARAAAPPARSAARGQCVALRPVAGGPPLRPPPPPAPMTPTYSLTDVGDACGVPRKS